MPAQDPTASVLPRRLPFLALGVVALAAGLLGGLARVGWVVPLPAGDVVSLHGALMIAGFFATVIGLERAVAADRAWSYAAPLASGSAGVALAAGLPEAGAAIVASLGAGVFTLASVAVWRRRPDRPGAVLALAAGCLLVGDLLWLAGLAMPGVPGWWLLFLVLTIAGERLELSRFRPPSRWAEAVFAALVILLLAAAAAGAGWPEAAAALTGAGFAGLGIWLIRFDIARRTVRLAGLPRFVAVCLLSGYVWLIVGGTVAVLNPSVAEGPWRDAALHAVLVGFVLSMVFGHAPIIVPAILRVAIPFRPRFYLPLALLHAGLALRVGADLADLAEFRQWGALLNVAAVLAFILVTAGTAVAVALDFGQGGRPADTPRS